MTYLFASAAARTNFIVCVAVGFLDFLKIIGILGRRNNVVTYSRHRNAGSLRRMPENFIQLRRRCAVGDIEIHLGRFRYPLVHGIASLGKRRSALAAHDVLRRGDGVKGSAVVRGLVEWRHNGSSDSVVLVE